MNDLLPSSEEDAWLMIIEACSILGWHFAIPNFIKDDEEVPGLIIGNQEYMDKILKSIEKYDKIKSGNKSIFEPGSKL